MIAPLRNHPEEAPLPEPQSYKTHRRYHPPYHFVTLPIFGINVLVALGYLIARPSGLTAWLFVLSIGLLLLTLIARGNALRVQSRLIRLEETLRLERCLPAELRPRIGELTPSHLVALRFCGDEQLPSLVEEVLRGEVRGRDQIKRRITSWRADEYRV